MQTAIVEYYDLEDFEDEEPLQKMKCKCSELVYSCKQATPEAGMENIHQALVFG